MLEIYNETIRDLLSSNRPSGAELTRTESGVGKQYTIKHDVNGNTHVINDIVMVNGMDGIGIVISPLTNSYDKLFSIYFIIMYWILNLVNIS